MDMEVQQGCVHTKCQRCCFGRNTLILIGMFRQSDADADDDTGKWLQTHSKRQC